MMKLLFGVLLAGMAATQAGCLATPGYSGGLPSIQFPRERATGENANNIVRAMAYDARQIADDFNSVLLLEPPSRMTKWNVR